MANEGHIIIKGGSEKPRQNSGRWGTKQFFMDNLDKGSSKPAFCYPRRSEGLKEELQQMDRNIKEGRVDPEQQMSYQLKAKKIRERVDLINESFENAKTIIDKAPDSWKTRRDTLAKEIADRTPTRDDKRKRRVNPHAILREEKVGSDGKRPLGDLKKEYTIISRAFQARGDYEEANHSYLEKDK
jgi:hypothetical protein